MMARSDMQTQLQHCYSHENCNLLININTLSINFETFITSHLIAICPAEADLQVHVLMLFGCMLVALLKIDVRLRQTYVLQQISSDFLQQLPLQKRW